MRGTRGPLGRALAAAAAVLGGAALGLALATGPRVEGGDVDLDARISKFDPPKVMKSGKTYEIAVHVENKGKKTWVPPEIALVCESKDPRGLKGGRPEFGFKLQYGGEGIPRGDTATFTGSVTAPDERGNWFLICSMTHEGEMFGDELQRQVFVLGTADWSAASIVEVDHESGSWTPGKSYPVTVTVANVGLYEWIDGDYYVTCVARTGPEGIDDGILDEVHFDAKFDRPAPGKDVDVRGSVDAPTWTGEYTLECWLEHDGDPIIDGTVTTFGVAREIDAKIATFTIDRKSKKATLKAGEEYPVKVTVQNTGDAAWNELGTYLLRCSVKKAKTGKKADGEKSFDTELGLPDRPVVEPGKDVDFTYEVSAPGKPGEWVLELQMYDQTGRKAFGEKEEFTVTVQ